MAIRYKKKNRSLYFNVHYTLLLQFQRDMLYFGIITTFFFYIIVALIVIKHAGDPILIFWRLNLY